MSKEKFEKLEEELIMRSQGNGYLKVPKEIRKNIRQKCEKEVKELATPALRYKIDDGKLVLKYSFDLEKEYTGDFKENEYV